MIAEAAFVSRSGRAESAGRALAIRKVAVLGAGTMGSRIAAHLANAGVPVVLLDIVPPNLPPNGGPRNAIVAAAAEALKKSKPAAFFEPGLARLITAGTFEDDLGLIADCDWIIEAVAENLEIKRALLERVEKLRRKDALVTTNTSGLPLAQIAEHMPEGFRRNWFGTHFFNPPRYMKLLEIIPTPDTDAAAIAAVEEFADRRLGKTIVVAKDTPNFIGNRIGTFAMMNAARVMQEMDLTIEQVDALTGSVLGWPKTGVFRLADMVGNDIIGHVAKNFHLRVRDERADVTFPDFLYRMLERGWLGDKAGQGFYKKVKGPDGADVRYGLDWKTLEYRPSEKAKFPLVDMAKTQDALADRIKVLLNGDPRKDKAAAFYWKVLPDLWNYAAHRIPEISDDVVRIDAAMKSGFNWEMGPFELWDAAGVPQTCEKMRAAGIALAPAVERLLAEGFTSWYRDDRATASGRAYFDVGSGAYQAVEVPAGVSSVAAAKKSRGVVKKNASASLVDLGDGVACIEFHSKMNSIGQDITAFVTQVLKPGSEALNQFEAFVISGDTSDFSVGANLMQLLLAIQEQDWYDIDLAIRAFQGMTQAIKFCPKPVVVAPFGMCLGGGVEIAIHGAARQAHAEVYMGLVETGVGLLPGGGGSKEMTLRALDAANAVREGARGDSAETLEALKRAFETLAMAKVSTSAFEARKYGFLLGSDGVTMNRARVLTDAKARAMEFAGRGYVAPAPRTEIPAPGDNILATLKTGVQMMREGEYISDHDVRVANALAYVMCGGRITSNTPVSEQYFLDLEREQFLSLCGEKKTQERIAFTLKTGKPLRN
ncbi:MAG: 3-hydroxyacyl-CoA dehydrogenase NAD-binding domain-containing protein [Bryobacteraceae bacterium]|nr:3-hydroxyacyl-CoA dehydrogenase NAD-binding domain-containing protein [Bryobacteraceae bacterium]